MLPEVQELVRQGLGSRKISEKLAVARSTVDRWLRELQASQRARSAENKAKLTRQVVARYKTIYREAMAEWRCSRMAGQTPPVELPPVEPPPGEKTAGGDKSTAGGKVAKKKSPWRSTGRTANYALLGKAMDALKAIRDIKGLDAPRQTELAGPGGGPIPLSAVKADDLSHMSNQELYALEAQLRAECAPDIGKNQG